MTARTPLPAPAPSDLPPAVPDAYLGVWRRSLLEAPGVHDTSSLVLWLQTPRWHADLRIPAGRPDFTGVATLADCDATQLAWLATQQGFCGLTQVDGERCTWHRQVDVQPINGCRDTGRMVFDGERMVETGLEADYREIWEPLPESRRGSAALQLVVENGALPARPTWLLIAGDCFMFVRGRAMRLPRAADLPSLIAATRPGREQLLAWLDIEVSFGRRNGPGAWHVEHSTLPFREGCAVLQPGTLQRRGHQLVVEGKGERRWMILDWTLDAEP